MFSLYVCLFCANSKLSVMAARRKKSSPLSKLESVIIQDTIFSIQVKKDQRVGCWTDLAKTSGWVPCGMWQTLCGMSMRYACHESNCKLSQQWVAKPWVAAIWALMLLSVERESPSIKFSHFTIHSRGNSRGLRDQLNNVQMIIPWQLFTSNNLKLQVPVLATRKPK